jgi:drug/metabolite transporter (DMT)-like permease
MTVVLALFASLFIGASDFLGGLDSRTRNPLETSLVLFLAALVTLVPIAILLGASDLTGHDLGLGAAGGLTAGIADVGFFAAIGHGRISVVAPISAAVTALLPALAGIAEGNALTTLASYGIFCALIAIPLVAYEPDDGEAGEDWSTMRQVLVSILCGVGFGFYFFCIGHTHRSSGLWPTAASFVVGIAVVAPIAARRGVLPTAASLSRLALAGGLALGVADSALTTALQRGPLTVASVLGNLYPLVTIALGMTLLGERMRLWHAAGILLALAGVAMIAAGQ